MSGERTVHCYRCGCETNEQIVHKKLALKYDGTHHDVEADVPALVCSTCGEKAFDTRADRILRRQLRVDLGLLLPEQIKELRMRYELTQAQLSARTGIAAETISRWECGRGIQSRANDRLLRYEFKSLAVERIPVGAGVYSAEYVVVLEQVYNATAPDQLQSAAEPQYALAA